MTDSDLFRKSTTKRRVSLFGNELTNNGNGVRYPQEYVEKLNNQKNEFQKMYKQMASIQNQTKIERPKNNVNLSAEKLDFLSSLPNLDRYVAEANVFLDKHAVYQANLELVNNEASAKEIALYKQISSKK